jgi:hypothetical protein
MWYQIRGKGVIVDPAGDSEPLATDLTVKVEAKNIDHLEAEYALFDGFRLADGNFAVFVEDMPVIEPLPADQLNLLVGAPTLFDVEALA